MTLRFISLLLTLCLTLTFSSLASADNQPAHSLDAQLLGYWYGETISMPVNGIRVNSRFTYLFLDDGQMYMGQEAAVKAAAEQSSEALEVKKGKWQVNEGMLLVEWENGAKTQRHYQVNGNAMEIRTAKGKLVATYQR